jgi:hypothetical protein
VFRLMVSASAAPSSSFQARAALQWEILALQCKLKDFLVAMA